MGRNEVGVVVVGAGFAGLYMLHRLRGTGLSAVVLEAGDGVGGTWYWNRYPGARCDSESYYYSYSFSEELQQEWEWTERYPAQEEILRYLEHVADRFDLRRDIRFGTRVTRAEFDDGTGRWGVHTAGGQRWSAQFVVTAVGCLSAANIPQIPGLDGFGGDWFHTGRWPHDGVDLAGKRVGVVGTGSTGIQVIPVVAEQAAHLTVFQRTANYSIPARNSPVDQAFRDEVKAGYADIRAVQRASTNGHPFLISPTSALEVPEDERRAIYEAAWERGGLRFRASFADLLVDRAANDTASEFIRDKIRGIVHDPATAEKLVPLDHPFATKRPPIDTHYFETFNRENVTLVDVRATPIEQITSTGVRTTAGEHELDVIVFATGFDAMTGPLLNIDVRGTGGVTLRERWAAGPVTYLGLQVAGFPNLFTITGPGSPSVLTNMPTSIEQHVDWITDAVVHLREEGIDRMEATPAAEDAWVAHVNEVAARTLLPEAATSWYLGANVPGKPRVFMPYAGGFAAYARACAEVVADGYPGFELTSR
ncbi:flavin-containing monooxygenase [Pseudonocardia abyssalis]|uniref:NAD(P)/FAD-dependent oxidoreductase n=1 Tax=Pseudonocardia abyssalis TaxID=2792008 RepID=A0ABS6UZN4_9PSEU|nr:NAD(P)/FAD-dependent oxidoreductase [Pseudonocardia abyssalis]MBW0114516.1 NAD(P)/FAD-dependent oxidoreductase [Pseudonocardia abyssalis]MBW0137721.1 NAD(P)/FAD-dependent oxidoreductase [Pseudonocardia abyssalis]